MEISKSPNGGDFIIRNEGLTYELENQEEAMPKVLGLLWDSQLDNFRFLVRVDLKLRKGIEKKMESSEDIFELCENDEIILTKRNVLSKIN